MKFYEIVLDLISNGKNIGKTSLQLESASQFSAAGEAENIVNGRYGESIYSHTIRVTPISEIEYIYGNCMAA